MANHKSAIKRIRQTKTRKIRNNYYSKSMRTSVKNLYKITDKDEANKKLPKVTSMIDRLAKNGVIHKNKASNIKSKLAKHVKAL